MSHSNSLRSHDVRAIVKFVGECRDLGDDWSLWQEHLALGLARLVDADLGFSGEVAECRSLKARPISPLIFRGQPGFEVNVAGIEGIIEDNKENLDSLEPMKAYFEMSLRDDGAALANQDVYSDKGWLYSAVFQQIGAVYGTDATLWCFRSIPGLPADESLGTTVCRAKGRRKFTGRDRTIVRETVAAIAPMMGKSLARFTDPAPGDLAPRVRDVLSCLLEGDSDKQVADRLNMSVYTVNQYTKIIYRHFGVRSRPELLARWIRRRWGTQYPGERPT